MGEKHSKSNDKSAGVQSDPGMRPGPPREQPKDDGEPLNLPELYDSGKVGPAGATMHCSLIPGARVTFPEGALTLPVMIEFQVQPITAGFVESVVGDATNLHVGNIFTIEPRRRKFHKATWLTMLRPCVEQFGTELHVLCCIKRDSPAEWDDITSTLGYSLTMNADSITLSTTVSAKFWLIECSRDFDAVKVGTDIYQEIERFESSTSQTPEEQTTASNDQEQLNLELYDAGTVGPAGAIMFSSLIPGARVTFPEGALTKPCRVEFQVQLIAADFVRSVVGDATNLHVGHIFTIEPKLQKFHKPLSLTMPKPCVQQFGTELTILCSLTRDGPARWDDITASLVDSVTMETDSLTLSTTVSARFWLIECSRHYRVLQVAADIYREIETLEIATTDDDPKQTFLCTSDNSHNQDQDDHS